MGNPNINLVDSKPKQLQSTLGALKDNLMRQAIEMSTKNKIAEISEFKVEFKVSRFLRLFIYHVLFFIIGPIVTFVIGIFDSFPLARNTGFSPLSGQRR